METKEYHLPVMAEEIATLLLTDPVGAYADCTLGGGGHTRRLLRDLKPEARIIALDRDADAVERGRTQFSQEPRVEVRHAPFSSLGEYCGEGALAGVLFDLGVSSWQIDEGQRGFSFSSQAPVDMRMDRREEEDARALLARWDEHELADVLRRNADIRPAGRIAASMKRKAMELGDSLTGAALASAIEEALPRGMPERNRTMARVFQAVRMEVNRELEEISEGLQAAIGCLRKGGRLAVLSYHSVEDRRVKEVLAGLERDCVCPPELPVCRCGGGKRMVSKVVRKPLRPSEAEVAINPRARSAKLRVAERV